MLNIVLFHYTFRGYAADNMSVLQFPYIGGFFKYGYLWVYAFFILSGYTTVMSAQNKNITEFLSARVFRLYPAFWVAVCITTTASMFLGNDLYNVKLGQFFVNLTMLNGYVGVKSVDGAYWFIFVILKFYFLVSLLILCKFIKFNDSIAGIWLIASFLIVFYDIPKVGFFLIPEYAPFMILGMICYSARESGWSVYKLCVSILSSFYSVYIVCKGIPAFNLHYNADLSLFIVVLVMLFIILFMMFVTLNKQICRIHPMVKMFGVSTYPLYLVHQNFGYMIFNRYYYLTNRFIILCIVLFLVCTISVIIVKYIDPFITNYLKKVVP